MARRHLSSPVSNLAFSIFSLASFGFLAAPGTAVAEDRKDLLLRVLDVQELAGGATVRDEILTYRDGTTLLLRNLGDAGAQFVRAEAETTEIDALKAVLVDQGIDRQLAGGCEAVGAGRVLADERVLEGRTIFLSWFGVDARRARHLRMTQLSETDPPAPCPAALTRVTVDFFDYAQAVLTGPSATSDPDTHYPRSLLIDVDNNFSADPSCPAFTFTEDMLVFRDGLFLRRYVDSDGAFRFTRSQVSFEHRLLFSEVLAENRIDTLRTTCRTWFFVPFVVEGRCRDYSWDSAAVWHGRNDRFGVIEGETNVEEACGPRPATIRQQLMQLVLNSLASPAASDAEGRFNVQ